MTSYFTRIFTTRRLDRSSSATNDGPAEDPSPTINRSKSTADTGKTDGGGGHPFSWKFWGRKDKEEDGNWCDNDDTIAKELDGQLGGRRFTYKALADATKNFNARTIIGRGGFGHVYKGLLKGEDKCVAIKKMHKASPHGKQQFLSEIKILSKLTHRNLIPLVGWCHEKEEFLLVYEFMPNGNLGSHLHPERSSSKKGLDWKTRYKVILGLAYALQYLHEEWSQCVLHRDIKPTNIMLDAQLKPRLADFGLARLMNHGSGEVITDVAGTPGYLPPECTSSGSFSKKTDVYSFGVVALEIACGRSPVASSNERNCNSLVRMVWDLHGKGKLLDGADERLNGSFGREQMKRVMMVGLWCTHPNVESRPFMRQAKQVLNFEDPLPSLPQIMPVPVYPAGMPSLMSAFCDIDHPLSRGSSGTRVFSHVSTRYFHTFVAKKPTNTSAAVVSPETSGKDETTESKFEKVTPSVTLSLTAQTHQSGRRLDGPTICVSSDPVPPKESTGAVSPGRRTQEIGLQANNIDIGIPPVYKPAAKLQPFQIPVIKGVTTALAEFIKTEPQLDEAVEFVRQFTSILVSLGAPLEDWSSLARNVLQAVKDIQDLKTQLIKDAADVETTTKTLSNLQKEVEDCSSNIEREKADLADSRRRLNLAGQERSRLEAEFTELQKQLADLQKRIRVAEDNCSVVQKSVTRTETSIAQRSRSMESSQKSVASTTETLQQKKEKRREKEGSVSTLVQSMLSRISSFSCNA